MRTSQWSGPIPVKEVVYAGVLKFTGGNTNIEFAIRDIKPIILEMYPDFKLSNVDAEITADCVNSPSRHHILSMRIDIGRSGMAHIVYMILRKTETVVPSLIRAGFP